MFQLYSVYITKILKSLLLIMVSLSYSYSQCNPDFIYSLLNIPGIWPDPTIGIDDATVNQEYKQTLTVIVPKDTTIDLLDFGFPVSLLVPVNINSFVIDDISGLPSGFDFQCASANCTYNNGETGCLIIEGTPDQSISNQTFDLTLNLTISIDLNDYGLGDQSFPYDVSGYELYVRPVTSSITDLTNSSLVLISINKEANSITIEFSANENANYTIELYDLLGQKKYDLNYKANKGRNLLALPYSSNLKGIYLLNISDVNQKLTSKLYLN